MKLSNRIDGLDLRMGGMRSDLAARIDSVAMEVAHIREMINVEKRPAVRETRLQ